MFELLVSPFTAFGEFVQLSGSAFRNIFRRPHYFEDILLQMDYIGFGSLFIIVLTGFFSGVVIAMQMAKALQQYGAAGQLGQIVALSLIRELGPELSALLVAGRNASGIASELGSMKVSEQIDAMRALGTDPVQKLVTPRLIATMFTLPLLTAIADFVGLLGGLLIATLQLGLSGSQYWRSAWDALGWSDPIQGLLKPFIFAIVISLVGCFYGMRTTGGTQGVGRSTTKAVVISSIWIFILTTFVTRIFINL